MFIAGHVEPLLSIFCCYCCGLAMVTGVQICGASIARSAAATAMGWRWSLVSGRRTDVGMAVTVGGLR